MAPAQYNGDRSGHGHTRIAIVLVRDLLDECPAAVAGNIEHDALYFDVPAALVPAIMRCHADIDGEEVAEHDDVALSHLADTRAASAGAMLRRQRERCWADMLVDFEMVLLHPYAY